MYYNLIVLTQIVQKGNIMIKIENLSKKYDKELVLNNLN